MKPSWLGSSLTCNIFSKSWLLCSDKSHIQKSGDVSACFFCTIKKQTKFPKHPLIYKIWAQLQILSKNFAWDFQKTFFAEHISVAASWNYFIISTLSFKIGFIQTFLNNILNNQQVSQKLWNTVSFHLLKFVQVAYVPKYHLGTQPVIFFWS